MKFTEFYEKYFLLKNPDGTTSKPRPLTPVEKQIYDIAEELKIPPYIRRFTRGREHFDINPIIIEKLKE